MRYTLYSVMVALGMSVFFLADNSFAVDPPPAPADICNVRAKIEDTSTTPWTNFQKQVIEKKVVKANLLSVELAEKSAPSKTRLCETLEADTTEEFTVCAESPVKKGDIVEAKVGVAKIAGHFCMFDIKLPPATLGKKHR